jgi:acyl-CoA synthetase (AMP-forming)/AMP-acid ligase II
MDIGLSWMPLTHDMGLIGMHIFLLANRAHMHQMTTELFVRRPVLWLQLAAEIRQRSCVLPSSAIATISRCWVNARWQNST